MGAATSYGNQTGAYAPGYEPQVPTALRAGSDLVAAQEQRH
jgi:hypothetical protein